MPGNIREYMFSFFGILENTTLNGLYTEFHKVTDTFQHDSTTSSKC